MIYDILPWAHGNSEQQMGLKESRGGTECCVTTLPPPRANLGMHSKGFPTLPYLIQIGLVDFMFDLFRERDRVCLGRAIQLQL